MLIERISRREHSKNRREPVPQVPAKAAHVANGLYRRPAAVPKLDLSVYLTLNTKMGGNAPTSSRQGRMCRRPFTATPHGGTQLYAVIYFKPGHAQPMLAAYMIAKRTA